MSDWIVAELVGSTGKRYLDQVPMLYQRWSSVVCTRPCALRPPKWRLSNTAPDCVKTQCSGVL